MVLLGPSESRTFANVEPLHPQPAVVPTQARSTPSRLQLRPQPLLLRRLVSHSDKRKIRAKASRGLARQRARVGCSHPAPMVKQVVSRHLASAVAQPLSGLSQQTTRSLSTLPSVEAPKQAPMGSALEVSIPGALETRRPPLPPQPQLHHSVGLAYSKTLAHPAPACSGNLPHISLRPPTIACRPHQIRNLREAQCSGPSQL